MRPRNSRSGLDSPDSRHGAVATIRGAFGLRGWVHVHLATDILSLLEPGRRILVGDELDERRILEFHPGRKPRLLLSGCDSRDEAQLLKGTVLYVDRAEATSHLDGRYFQFQIEGLEVLTEDGEQLGTVIGIVETGANDVYEVAGPSGEFLIPAVKPVIRRIDLEAGEMIVVLPAGLLAED